MYKEQEILEYIKKANKMLDRSYSPYSHFKVSAIVVDQNNNEYYGVNVENAAYPLCLCAERNAITTGVTNGLRKIKLIAITCEKLQTPVSPCGACRQVISEFSDKDTVIILANSKNEKYIKCNVDDILPYGFSKESL